MSPLLPEAARLTQEILDETGMTKKDIGDILNRNASLVSQFFTKGKGGSMTTALRTVRDAIRGGERDKDTLQALAAQHMTRRTNAQGRLARTRGRDALLTPGGSGLARAARTHLASGGSRLAPIVEHSAARGGRFALTTRARPSAYPAPDDDEYPHYEAVKHTDGTEERRYGNQGRGYSTADLQEHVDAHGGDVHHGVTSWMTATGQLKEGATLTHLEIRTWG